MNTRIGIVDLFSGPDGLGKGFTSVRSESGEPVFEIDLSVEADAIAHGTLRLRSFLRKVPGGFPAEHDDWQNGLTAEPDWASIWPEEWRAAAEECRHLELGTEAARALLAQRIPEIKQARAMRPCSSAIRHVRPTPWPAGGGRPRRALRPIPRTGISSISMLSSDIRIWPGGDMKNWPTFSLLR